MLRLLTLLLLSLVPLAHAAPLDEAQTRALFSQLEAHHASQAGTRMGFEEERRLRALNRPVATSGLIELGPDGRFRREVTGKSPSTLVFDGSKLWIHYPAFNEVELYDVDQSRELRGLLAALDAGLRFRGLGELYSATAESNDSGGHTLRLTPLRADLAKLLAFIDVAVRADLSVESVSYETTRGDRTVTRYAPPEFGPRPDGTFSFTPPEGANVTRPLSN